jgi:hypothetical protein
VRKPTSVYAMKGATVSNSAKAISHTDFAWAGTDLAEAGLCKATITARTGGVMFTMDGTDPTTTLGHLIAAGATYVVEGTPNNITRLKFIREAGTDSSVTISLEK